jgi:hypothetical protein
MYKFRSNSNHYNGHEDDLLRIGDYSQNQIKVEPMLFSCDTSYARIYGGPITHAFLDQLEKVPNFHYNGAIIDSRVHMLFKDFYPAIPGWHHDDIPRTRSDGQPNYNEKFRLPRHIMCLLNGDVAPTEFAIGEAEFPKVEIGKKVYKEWSPLVDKAIEDGKMRLRKAESNTLIEFDGYTWHRGVAAVKAGWRFFIRASVGTDRTPKNEIRQQVQVYLPCLEEGW